MAGIVRVRNPKTDAAACPRCGGSGLVVILRKDGEQFAAQCECHIARKATLRLQRARIPERYTHCQLDNFETGFRGAEPSLGMALVSARRFAESFPVETDGRGLLLTGSIGAGKTHLAVGVLRELVENKGAAGLFCDYRELLKEIQHSYNPQVATTELDILRPVFDAEVLVLDELGAVKPTDWVWDTVAHILNTRYNHKRTTIITTNYANLAPAMVEAHGAQTQRAAAARAMREETLGDRIGERMRSRLQEMCIPVLMQGEDFRQKVRRASF
ncbi:MAG TPA: ATP-binding protein [Acidobacteriaceae bacterium]|nr:ATP-binding protein [Acidobacteriaceae bacterium]